jgi:hypothetical protein
MKRHFTNATLITSLGASFLACCCAAQSPVHKLKAAATALPPVADLQLVIEGPFILCERNDYLQIVLPNLDKNHYPPGFTAQNSSYPLDNGWKPVEYTLAFQHTGAGATMVLKNDGNGSPGDVTGGGPATLYRENQSCPDTIPSAAVSIHVDKPDEILPLSDGMQLTAVLDQIPNPPGTPQGTRRGQCHKDLSFCKHANQVRLLYSKTVLDSIHVTCAPNADCPVPPHNVPWPPLGAFVPYPDAELFLDVHPVALTKVKKKKWPVPSSINKACQPIRYNLGNSNTTAKQAMEEEEAEAFCTATAMALPQTSQTPTHARYLLPDSPLTEDRQVNQKKWPSNHLVPFSAPDHRDCIVPPTLFCTSAACSSVTD